MLTLKCPCLDLNLFKQRRDFTPKFILTWKFKFLNNIQTWLSQQNFWVILGQYSFVPPPLCFWELRWRNECFVNKAELQRTFIISKGAHCHVILRLSWLCDLTINKSSMWKFKCSVFTKIFIHILSESLFKIEVRFKTRKISLVRFMAIKRGEMNQ